MTMLQEADIFVTGGAGTLGTAIAQRRKDEGWTGRLTVYSTDEHKHARMRKRFPDVGFIQGDIRNPETLYNGMVGHDVVIHAAAVKVIPVSEFASLDTIDVNVIGSQNVCYTALRAGIRHVLGISTDKACHAANAYGATKLLMEKVFQEYARVERNDTEFHLVRYGNVLESTGSVLEMWKRSADANERIRITNASMTRFWLSPSQAVNYVEEALECGNGITYIPKMPALSVGKLADYFLGDRLLEVGTEEVPLRPGEKMHETLLTVEETARTLVAGDNEGFFLFPTTYSIDESFGVSEPYVSDTARELTKEEFLEFLE